MFRLNLLNPGTGSIFARLSTKRDITNRPGFRTPISHDERGSFRVTFGRAIGLNAPVLLEWCRSRRRPYSLSERLVPYSAQRYRSTAQVY